MQNFVNVKAKRAEAVLTPVLSARKVRAKCDLFSLDVMIFMTAVLCLSSFLVVNSYLKSYRNAQLVKITAYADMNRASSFKKNELQSHYLKITSVDALMKKAEEMKLEVVTKDKIMNF